MRHFLNFVINTAVFFAGRTPRWCMWWIGGVLGYLWFDVLKIRRYTVLRNISIAFPEKSKQERYRLARLSMRYLCYGFPEMLSIPSLDEKRVSREVVFHGIENLRAVEAKGKGVLGLSLHLGNGDFGVAALAIAKVAKMHLISKKFKNKIVNDIWFGLREKQGVKFIDPHGLRSAQEILAACRAKELVLFVLDQYIASPFGIESKFFGRKTGTAVGLARFSLKLGAPVVPMYTYRDAELKTHVVIGPEVVVPSVESESSDQLVARMTQHYSDCLEQLIRQHPEQWMWVHRRWKKWR